LLKTPPKLPLRPDNEGRNRTLLWNRADETVLLRAPEQVVSVHPFLHRSLLTSSNRNMRTNHDGSVILQRSNERKQVSLSQ